MNLKYLSLFSGIGAPEKALINRGKEFDLIGYSEIDKYASKSYQAIHGVTESMNLGDITKIDEKALPKDIDLITYGFPCQDISLAGKQKGLFNEDGTQTRSGLFFEALRIIKETQPKVAIAENVKNLTGKTFKEQFEIVLDSLDKAGYNNYWKVLNAKDFGIPQNRERVFIISIRKDIDTGNFKFPEGFPLELQLKDMLEDVVDEKYYIKEERMKIIRQNLGDVFKENFIIASSQKNAFIGDDTICPTLTTAMGNEEPRVKQIGNWSPGTNRSNPNQGRIYDPDGLAPCLNQMGGGNRQPFIPICDDIKGEKYAVAMRGRYNKDGKVEQQIEWSDREYANAITTVQKDSLIGEENLQIRKLTPKECFRLQGFTDADWEKAASVNSNTQLYKQAGNSICVPVLEHIYQALSDCGILNI